MATKNYWEPDARWGHCAVAVDEKVYLWNGFSHSVHATSKKSLQEEFAAQVSVLDLKTKLWSLEMTFGCPPPLTRGSACTTDGEQAVYQFGGYIGPGERWSNALHMLDTKTMRWDVLPQRHSQNALLAAKQDCGMVFHKSELCKCSMLVVVGGYGSGRIHSEYTNELHTYRLDEGMIDCIVCGISVYVYHTCVIGKWCIPEITGSGPAPCSGFSFTTVDSKRAVFFGGANKKGYLNKLYFLNMENWVS